MTDAARPQGGDSGTAIYVYGVVPKEASPDLLADVPGIDPSHPVVLVTDREVAAITSAVPLEEFGAEAIEDRLRDPEWLEEKVRAHDAVLEAALERTTVLPFRFGAIYLGEAQVRQMLAERSEFAGVLSRLRGAIELGVKGIVDRDAFRERLADERGLGQEAVGGGRAYMERKQFDRDLDEALRRFATDCAHESHERLAAAAAGARANAVQQREVLGPEREMLLNGAYLVRADQLQGFRTSLSALQERYGPEGVTYELTGPWPPYNFVQGEGET
jgi:hypothetical protein